MTGDVVLDSFFYYVFRKGLRKLPPTHTQGTVTWLFDPTPATGGELASPITVMAKSSGSLNNDGCSRQRIKLYEICTHPIQL